MNNDKIELSNFKKSIAKLGCNIEELKVFSLLSIDIPAVVNVNKLDCILSRYEKKGVAFAFPVWRHDR